VAACSQPMITAVKALSTFHQQAAAQQSLHPRLIHLQCVLQIVSAMLTCENVRRPVRPSSPVNVQLAFAMVAFVVRLLRYQRSEKPGSNHEQSSAIYNTRQRQHQVYNR
jgi:hypothetical protein